MEDYNNWTLAELNEVAQKFTEEQLAKLHRFGEKYAYSSDFTRSPKLSPTEEKNLLSDMDVYADAQGWEVGDPYAEDNCIIMEVAKHLYKLNGKVFS